MILADRRDYSIGYRKHRAAYVKLKSANSDTNSRRLLLIYCVECGLKYKLLEKWGMNNPNELIGKPKEELDTDDRRKREILSSHDLEKILKELGQLGTFRFPQPKTIHGERVSPQAYHELYRYCIRTCDGEERKETELENSLSQILTWIEEGV